MGTGYNDRAFLEQSLDDEQCLCVSGIAAAQHGKRFVIGIDRRVGSDAQAAQHLAHRFVVRHRRKTANHNPTEIIA